MNRACAVETTDEDHIPKQWRSGALGAVKTAQTGEVCSKHFFWFTLSKSLD
jgi:hypothetical protein